MILGLCFHPCELHPTLARSGKPVHSALCARAPFDVLNITNVCSLGPFDVPFAWASSSLTVIDKYLFASWFLGSPALLVFFNRNKIGTCVEQNQPWDPKDAWHAVVPFDHLNGRVAVLPQLVKAKRVE